MVNEMTGEIEYAPLSKMFLDPQNPRLGRAVQNLELSQDEIYDRMRDWSLEELATSFLESGFWSHEAVLCIDEGSDEEERLVVVEGNRRIAALQRLLKAFNGEEQSRKWLELIKNVEEPKDLFSKIPFIRINSREEVDSFLGFRHVTGIKEWAPPEKAQFIAKLIDERGYSYKDVMRKIGSKTLVVERNYIAYSILVQMEDIEGIGVEEIENRFSVLFLSLRSKHIQNFLGIEGKFGIEPNEVKPPVDDYHIDNLIEYSIWLFGDAETSPVVKDSRDVDKFAFVLASEEGLQYLRTIPRPSLEKAFVIAGGDKEEVYTLISEAALNLQEALSFIHMYKDDDNLLTISRVLITHAEQIKTTLNIS